jgi:hypothetical protein
MKAFGSLIDLALLTEIRSSHPAEGGLTVIIDVSG